MGSIDITADDRDDVPIRVDFRDPETARTWIEETRVKRPYRPNFFAAFCAALAPPRRGLRVLELGSGPGQLARELLAHCEIAEYVALDFSPAMHAIAAEHLGAALAARTTFVLRDFRDPAWADDLGPFDAVVTLQAAHETRHTRHLVPLLARARTTLAAGGSLLYADHYLTPATRFPALAPVRDDQPRALERAGFADVALLHEEGNMALWRGTMRAMADDVHAEARAMFADYVARAAALDRYRRYAEMVVKATSHPSGQTPVEPLATLGKGGGALLCEVCKKPMILEGGGFQGMHADDGWSKNPKPGWTSYISGGMVVQIESNKTVRIYHGYPNRSGCVLKAVKADDKARAKFREDAEATKAEVSAKLAAIRAYLKAELPDKHNDGVMSDVYKVLFVYDPGLGLNSPD